MNNKELAQVFSNIADLLEIKGEIVYKVLAYRRAAASLEEYNRNVREVWQADELTSIPGVGDALAEKIAELLQTGQLGFYEKLKTEVPVELIDLLRLPEVGPKKAALFWKKLQLTTVAQLEAAAQAGKLRDLPGLGEKSEAKILAGIEASRRAAGRVPLGQAWPVAQEIVRFLRGLPGVESAEIGGSLRRMRATIGDLDFLAGADEAHAPAVLRAFVSLPQVERITGHGPTKAAVDLAGGLRAQLRVLPARRFGTLLQYFTGSQAHNVRLRELALEKDLSLSENAFTRPNGQEILCANEAEVYRTLGLAYIPPELREDRGEIQAAAEGGKLPRLVDLKDLQSDLHTHTTWSDGRVSLREMALAARSRGLKLLAITDHSHSLGITGGLTPERLRAQRRELDQVQAEMGHNFSLLQGAEVEIRADGALDYPDAVLDDLDIVVASLHTSLRQERDKITARLIGAIRSRHVDIIGHPTGRLLPGREAADLDMEAVLRAAAESGVALEINANPSRLDLDDGYARRALELGCLLSINTDAHEPAQFDLAHFGIGQARRAWLPPEAVINTWTPEKLLHWLDERSQRRRPVAAGLESAPPARPKAAPKPAAAPAAEKKSAPKKAAAKPAPRKPRLG